MNFKVLIGPFAADVCGDVGFVKMVFILFALYLSVVYYGECCYRSYSSDIFKNKIRSQGIKISLKEINFVATK